MHCFASMEPVKLPFCILKLHSLMRAGSFTTTVSKVKIFLGHWSSLSAIVFKTCLREHRAPALQCNFHQCGKEVVSGSLSVKSSHTALRGNLFLCRLEPLAPSFDS